MRQPQTQGTPIGAHGASAGTWRRPMVARSPDEEHRTATALELFFDLCFVVAVAQAAAGLHHAVADGHVAAGVLGYVVVFFAIWWAWMNFTWFASAYDTDDVAYRLTTLVQITGALILAAGVPRALDGRDFAVITLGYVVMRLAMVTQWLRAAGADAERRRCCLRYAVGITVVQAGWVARLTLPHGWAMAGIALLVVAELAVPIWAERAAPTTWHPHHVAERYGLFTLIVLGEVVGASTLAVQSALDADAALADLATIATGGLLTLFLGLRSLPDLRRRRCRCRVSRQRRRRRPPCARRRARRRRRLHPARRPVPPDGVGAEPATSPRRPLAHRAPARRRGRRARNRRHPATRTDHRAGHGRSAGRQLGGSPYRTSRQITVGMNHPRSRQLSRRSFTCRCSALQERTGWTTHPT
jgi:hypothetical protein